MKYPFSDFQKVSLKHFVFLFRKNESGGHKIIFRLKRTHYNAVSRNRIKRVIRESMRSVPFPPAYTIVVFSAGRTGKGEGAALKSDLDSLMRIIS